MKRDKEIPFRSEHVAVRTYRITLEEALKPGEYAFFMGTGESPMMSSSSVATTSGGSASGRIYDFTIPD